MDSASPFAAPRAGRTPGDPRYGWLRPAGAGGIVPGVRYFALEPEVAGGLGPGTRMDHSVVPARVVELDYEFGYGWQGDELLESFPCFILSARLCDALTAAGATGWEIADVRISVELGVDYDLPPFRRLVVTGAAGHDDLGIADDRRLVVSERALDALRAGISDACDVEPLS